MSDRESSSSSSLAEVFRVECVFRAVSKFDELGIIDPRNSGEISEFDDAVAAAFDKIGVFEQEAFIVFIVLVVVGVVGKANCGREEWLGCVVLVALEHVAKVLLVYKPFKPTKPGSSWKMSAIVSSSGVNTTG